MCVLWKCALKSLSYMFMMPIAGVVSFSFLLTSWHYMFGDPGIGLFSPNILTELSIAGLLAWVFWVALKGSLKVRKEIRAHINGEENDT